MSWWIDKGTVEKCPSASLPLVHDPHVYPQYAPVAYSRLPRIWDIFEQSLKTVFQQVTLSFHHNIRQIRVRFLCLVLFLFLIPHPSWSSSPAWKSLLPGLQQASWVGKDSQGNSVVLELYKVDPKQFRLQIVQAQDFQLPKITAKEMVQKTGALLAINAGFFDPQYKPLGLLAKEGAVLNPLRSVSWWGVFSYDRSQGARVDRPEDFQVKSTTELAIQVGPRLVDGGRVMPVKHNDSQKTFIGIAPNNEIILGVTELCAIDATDFANILLRELQVKEALNLDGGSSTQLYTKIGSYEKDLPGVTAVANGIVVLKR